MSATLEERVTVLEGKVENLETNPQPGQNDAFSLHFRELRGMLGKQRQILEIHTGKLGSIDSHLNHIDIDLISLNGTVRDFTAQVTGKVEGFESQVDRLEEQVTSVRDNVTVLEVNLGEVKEEVSGISSRLGGLEGRMDRLETDVTELKTDVSGLKTDMGEVKGTLAEILDRLPPKAA